ncbi:hypothetical protein HYV88_01750 [Candidatus Woesearchaeota archaeon]|nr:hypothetical protein [Candidatus Woesearchaeota archaeon]
MKKGQTTIYVALGLVLIMVIGGLVYFLSRQNQTPPISSLRQQSEDVKNLIKTCFEENLLQALYLVGVQGGHIKGNEKSVAINSELSVGYGYYEGEDVLVTNNEIVNEVTNYLNFAVSRCADFSRFNSFDIKKLGEARSRIDIFDDKVVGRLSYPVSVSKGDEIINYDELYIAEYGIRLGKMLKTAKGIIENEKINPDFIDIDFLKEADLNIRIYDIDVNTNLYIITDDQSVVNGVQYVFEFANKF